MSDLFGGTLGFTPAFTGQQLAIQSGQATAQAFTSGMNAGTNRKQEGLSEREFAFKKKQYDDTVNRLKAFTDWLGE